MIISFFGALPGHVPLDPKEAVTYSETSSWETNLDNLESAQLDALKFQETTRFKIAKGGLYLSTIFLLGMFLGRLYVEKKP